MMAERAKGMKRRLVFVLLLAIIHAPGLAFGEERLSISATTANIRNGPGTNFEVVWKVEQYYPVIVLEKKESWFKIQDFEGDKGWLHNSLLDKTETVVVKNDNSNVRSGPGTDFPVVFRAQKGVPFKIMKVQGEWLNIRHADGDNGWIHRTLTW